MKNALLSIFLVFFLTCPVLAVNIATEEVPFEVTVNGQRMTGNDEYPLLFCNGIVYLPTTLRMNDFVGLRVEFYPENDAGRSFGRIFVGLNERKTDEYLPYSKTTETGEGIVHEEVIVVNAWTTTEDIGNSTREYPVINSKNVLYLPLTYDLAVEKLDWKLRFTPEDGLFVDTTRPNRPILDALQSSVVGFTGNPKAVLLTEYVWNETTYVGYPASTFEGNEFRYKEVGGSEVRNRIPLTDAEYYFNRKTVTGKDVTYTEDCVAILEPDGILKMPAVKKEYVNGEYIGKNVYLTIDVKNGLLISCEET